MTRKLKFHPYADIFPLLDGDDFDAAFRDRPAVSHISRPFQMVTVSPSTHAGYWHVQRIDAASACEETKRPMRRDAVAYLLRKWGFSPDESAWRELSQAVNDGAGHGEPSAEPTPRNVVYFLRAGPFIKIGFTGGLLRTRIDQLKTGCPYKIQPLATMAGGPQTERALHERFKAHRVNLEWFRAAEEIKSFIREHADAV